MAKNKRTFKRISAQFATLALVLACSASGIAAAQTSTLAWSGFRTIQSVDLEGANTVFVVDGAQAAAQSSCNNKFRIDANDPDGVGKVAAVNAAHNSGKKVNVSFDSASTACSVLAFEIQVQ